ncbi:PspC domain-containing protein [Arcanobacterium urinimassiliense]|uniref:PspC domain-containing protein n=1 Tax=Arcanobacterium urinimassiliense TaxID=1871014 RepID=UPI00093C47F8|nr:PspC domain-containing protein [Arcanobacterium urinimassiliense]
MKTFFATMRTYPYRRTNDKMLGGLCAGLAHRWGLAPTFVRLLALLLLPVGLISLFLYGVFWLIIPEYRSEKIVLEDALNGQPTPSLAIAIIFIILGFSSTSYVFRAILGISQVFLTPLAIICLIAFAFITILAWGRARKHPELRQNQNTNMPPSPNSDLNLALNPDLAPTANSDGTNAENTTNYSSANAYNFTDNSTFTDSSAPATAVKATDEPFSEADHFPITPQVSSRYIALTVVAIFLTFAGILLFYSSTLGAWLAASGGALTVLGISVTVAGIRGKRATWLTFFTWLSLLAVLPAVTFAACIPSQFLTEKNTQVFYASPITGNTKNVQALFLIPPRPLSGFQPDNTYHFQAAIGTTEININEDVPVILHIKGGKYGTMQIYHLRSWKVVEKGQSTLLPAAKINTAPPASAAPRRPYFTENTFTIADEYPVDTDQVIDSESYYRLYEDEETTLYSPAAVQDSSHAAHVYMYLSFGQVQVYGEPPVGVDEKAWVETKGLEK